MNRIYKISISLAILLVVFGLANFVLAAGAGKGYYLEVNDILFMYNNLRFNGYLVVEDNLSDRVGKLGDLLVENQLIADSAVNFYFCNDSRDSNKQPLNPNCPDNDKSMVWSVNQAPDVFNQLKVIKNSLYQLNTDKIIAGGEISFAANQGQEIRTEKPVRLKKCFHNETNAGTSTACATNGNELYTNFYYTDSLKPLTVCIGGTNAGKVCNNNNECPGGKCNSEVIFSPNKLVVTRINVGPEENLNNQNLCFKTDTANCALRVPTSVGGLNNMQGSSFYVDLGGTLGGYVMVYPGNKTCEGGTDHGKFCATSANCPGGGSCNPTGWGIVESQICCHLDPVF